MFEWHLKDVCKNNLSEKDANSILDYPWKKFLNKVS